VEFKISGPLLRPDLVDTPLPEEGETINPAVIAYRSDVESAIKPVEFNNPGVKGYVGTVELRSQCSSFGVGVGDVQSLDDLGQIEEESSQDWTWNPPNFQSGSRTRLITVSRFRCEKCPLLFESFMQLE
jgi:hypothetical protein